MKTYLLLVLFSVSAVELPGRKVWNRIKEVRSLVDDGSLSGLKSTGAIVSSAISVATEISSQISSVKQVQSKNNDLLTKQREMRAKGVSTLIHSSENSKAEYLAALSSLSDAERLEEINLRSGRLLGIARQAYFLVGELLNQQSMTEEAASLDKDLASLDILGEKINDAVYEVNRNLEEIDGLTSDAVVELNSSAIIQQTIQVNEQLGKALKELQDALDDGINAAKGKISSFASDVEFEVETLESAVNAISRDINEGISQLLLGQIEADTKAARECYRKILEFFRKPIQKNQKPTLLFLLSDINVLSPSEKATRDQLISILNHIETGVDACVREFRAVFDPAVGSPKPRGLFTKLRERFELEHHSPGSWNEAASELNKFKPMLTQMLIQLTNLYIFDSVVAVSGNSTNGRLDSKIQSLDRFLENSEILMRRFNDNFPPCEITHPMEAGIRMDLLYCNKPISTLGQPTEIEFNRRYGIPLGTQCKWECYNLLEDPLPSITCGPKGKFSWSHEELTQDFLKCRNAVNGFGDSVINRVKRDLLEEVSTQIDSNINERLSDTANSLKQEILRNYDSIAANTRKIFDAKSFLMKKISANTATLEKIITDTEVQLRLIDSSGRSNGVRGRVEVYFLGEWGTICDDSFGTEEAAVVCRQLGRSGGSVYTAGTSSPGNGKIWLDDLRCTGSEIRIHLCQSLSWGSHNCQHTEDVGVECS